MAASEGAACIVERKKEHSFCLLENAPLVSVLLFSLLCKCENKHCLKRHLLKDAVSTYNWNLGEHRIEQIQRKGLGIHRTLHSDHNNGFLTPIGSSVLRACSKYALDIIGMWFLRRRTGWMETKLTMHTGNRDREMPK